MMTWSKAAIDLCERTIIHGFSVGPCSPGRRFDTRAGYPLKPAASRVFRFARVFRDPW